MVVIVTILVDLVDSRPLRYEHWKGQLYDVKIPRHLNVHWGQQFTLFGLIHLNLGQQNAVRRLVGVWGVKMQNTKSKSCFLKVRLYVLNKMVSINAENETLYLLFVAFTQPISYSTSDQQPLQVHFTPEKIPYDSIE